MYASTALAEDVLSAALRAVESQSETLIEALEDLPAPIYVTDADGTVTHFNKACIGFAGRRPAAGEDRWCVSWRLYTDAGDPLPHHECPMALAIQSGRTIRGVTAVAERPDGTRVNFMPFPTPIFGPEGELRGAINMLVDVTELRQIAALKDQSARAERLASGWLDRATAQTLRTMAAECLAEAARLEQAVPCPYVRVA
jgi:PAS domain S-box-containing protein